MLILWTEYIISFKGGFPLQYLMTFIWTLILSEMVVYVVSSMNGAAFHFETGVLISILATVLLFVLTALIPNDPIEKH